MSRKQARSASEGIDQARSASEGNRLIRAALLLILLAVPPALLLGPAPGARRPEERTVFVGGGLSEEEVIVFTATVAASGRPAVVLLDTPAARKANARFLAAYRPGRVLPVGSFPGGAAGLTERVGDKAEPVREWKGGPPSALWEELF